MSELRIYLRGVDLVDLTQRYLAGEFRHLTDPIPLTKVSEVQPIKGVRTTSDVKSYQVEIAGHTLACIGYKVYDKTGHYASFIPEGGYNCMQCLRKIPGQCMGIPILREEVDKKIYYHMIDVFCSFECIYTEYKRRRHNTLYSHSMAYLGEIYQKMTGRDVSELKELSDRRILKKFNGPVTYKEYHDTTKTFPEKPGNVFFLPVLEYLEQESSK